MSRFPKIVARFSDIRDGDGTVDHAFFMIGIPHLFLYITNGLLTFEFTLNKGRRMIFKISIHDNWNILLVLNGKLHRLRVAHTFWKYARKLGIRKPFKGNVAYEWQVFMLYVHIYFPRERFLQSPITRWSTAIKYDSDWKFDTIWR